MPRRAKPLTARRVESAGPGRYYDGGGLLLEVKESGAASWGWRFTINGRTREMGMGAARGPYRVLLKEVREKAAECRRMIRDGVDPLAGRDRAKVPAVTFRQAAEQYHAAHCAGWSMDYSADWIKSVATYACPVIGDMDVSTIGTEHVMQILGPIWRTKTESASRLRGQLEEWVAIRARGAEWS
jgi:Arm DNA-binding domain